MLAQMSWPLRMSTCVPRRRCDRRRRGVMYREPPIRSTPLPCNACGAVCDPDTSLCAACTRIVLAIEEYARTMDALRVEVLDLRATLRHWNR